MRYLAIDPGDKRTGLAVGDDETGLVSPVDVVEAADPASLLGHVKLTIDEYQPDALVVGVPYDMDGATGPAARKALALAHMLQAHAGLDVHTVDERLTSFDADDRMRQTGLTHGEKKQRRDALAAAAICRDFLESR